jgi:hypothetical protein
VKNRSFALLLLTSALALGACGGDDKPSKDAFVKEADKLCVKTNEEGTKLAQESFDDPNKPTGEEAQAFIVKAVPLQRKLLEDIGDLERPAGDDDEIQALLDAAEEGTKKIEDAGKSPGSALALLESDDDPLAKADELAGDYGLKECAD